MKKIITIAILMLALVACKDQVAQVSGSYSYKISGRVNVQGTQQNLSDEIGTMEIIRDSANSAVLTFNALRGPIYYTKAKINGKHIELDTLNRTVTQSAISYQVKVSGSGTVYDNSIIFNLRYSGTSLNADSLVMVCKRN